jgi:hypothetical protein
MLRENTFLSLPTITLVKKYTYSKDANVHESKALKDFINDQRDAALKYATPKMKREARK